MLVAVIASLLLAGAARAQVPRVRLAAPASCPLNVNCIPGLKRVYRVDPSGSLVRLRVADAGVQALDDGIAEVAVVFTSNPQLSRPDIVALRDDRRMVTADHVVPVVRSSLLRAYGPVLREPFDEASRLLSTLRLRGLNQLVIDGRLPEAVGGEFVEANGLADGSARRRGPRIVVGFMDFAENETLAYMYAEVLRAGGYRVTVRSVRGLRPQAVALIRRDRIDLYPAYDGSLLRYLVGTSRQRLAAGLRPTLARIDAEPMRLSRAQNRNVFVTKTDTAARLGLARISDLARYWGG